MRSVQGHSIPLLNEFRQVVVHVGFELGYVFRGEGVGYCLSLTSVFCSIAGVEETSLDGDEGIVVVAVQRGLSAFGFVEGHATNHIVSFPI